MQDIFTGDCKKLKKKNEKYMVIALLCVFFGALFCFGPGHYPDTPGYISMDMAREPLYPLFLMLCRTIAGEQMSLWLASFLQNLFCAVNVYLIYFYVKKMCFPMLFSADSVKRTKRDAAETVLSILLLGSLLVPHLVTPLFSSSHMILSNGIISEGLCYPLYQLFIYQLLKVLWEGKKGMGTSFVLSFLLCLVRGQMMVTIPIWALVCGYRIVRSSYKKRWLFVIASGVLVLFTGRAPAIAMYNGMIHGIYAQNTSNNLTVLTSLLYASERENGEAIEDERLRELFYQMYDAMEEKEYTYHFAGYSMQERAVHQEYTHDYIKFDVVTPVLKEAVQSLQESEHEEGVLIDRLAGYFTKPLLRQNIGGRVSVYVAVVWCGLVRTAAVLMPGINFLTIVMYVVLAILCIRTLRKRRDDRIGLLLLFALMIVCANVSATGLMIMCLSRYVVYNTSFLYIAALLMLWKTTQELAGKNGVKKNGANRKGAQGK